MLCRSKRSNLYGWQLVDAVVKLPVVCWQPVCRAAYHLISRHTCSGSKFGVCSRHELTCCPGVGQHNTNGFLSWIPQGDGTVSPGLVCAKEVLWCLNGLLLTQAPCVECRVNTIKDPKCSRRKDYVKWKWGGQENVCLCNCWSMRRWGSIKKVTPPRCLTA